MPRITIGYKCTFFISVMVCAISCPTEMLNHSYIFISGWPQSGTSLVQQIFTIAPHASTMVQKCFETKGSYCANVNNEGQWLANKGNTRWNTLYQPGKMCQSGYDYSSVELTSIRQAIFSEWKPFWDMKRTFLVEKSPQALLKINLLRDVFKDCADNMRFLVVIKHPISLNIATPRHQSWLYHRENPEEPILQAMTSPNSFDQIVENFKHFINFMTISTYDYAKKGQRSTKVCKAMGWLPAMELFLVLQQQRTEGEVRIMRYEDFSRPYETCKAMVAFAYAGVCRSM